MGVNIFLRELRGILVKAKPKPSMTAINTAYRIDLKDIAVYERALVRLNLEYCKKAKCKECLVKNHTKEITTEEIFSFFT